MTRVVIDAIVGLAGTLLGLVLGTFLERRRLLWSKEVERLLALEELAGRCVEELSSYRPLAPKVGSMLEEFREAAGRFARYDHVLGAIRQLQNTLDRMLVAKRDHTDDEQELRSELDRDRKQLQNACDQITKRKWYGRVKD